MGIVVFGSVFVDIKGYPIGSFIPDGRNAGHVIQVHGGVSRNVVEDIANVELRPTFVSVVDETGTGTDVIEKLNRHHVNTKYIRRVKDGCGIWLAVFDNSGNVVSSISARPSLDEIGNIMDEYGEEIISGADSVVVEIDMEPHILKKIFNLAEKYNKTVYAVVSNMTIAMERRDLLKKTGCIVCNEEEAGLLFSDNLEELSPEEMQDKIRIMAAGAEFPRMVVTMGGRGAVYTEAGGESGCVKPKSTAVVDTTGAGDSFFAGVTIGLTYGKTLGEACEIGTRLAASVIATKENVCPRFMPSEFGIDVPVEE